MPQRLQRKRMKGWRMGPNGVSITRPGKWGNRFPVGSYYKHLGKGVWFFLTGGDPATLGCKQVKDITESLELHRQYASEILNLAPNHYAPLRGKDLYCFCPVGQPCHGDVLLEFANR